MIKKARENQFSRKEGSGRPRKICKRTSLVLEEIISGNPRQTLSEITNVLARQTNLTVSKETVRKNLKENGVCAHKAINKPLLNQKNRKRRLEIAKNYLFKEDSFWSNVIFSDEATVKLFPQHKNAIIYRKKGEELLEKNIIRTKKFGGGKVMFWGCMSAKGVGHLIPIKGNINSATYIRILSNNLIRSAKKMELDSFVFQQDGAPCHRAKNTEEWFERKGIELLEWPAQSPDLNPIENLWSIIKKKLQKYTFNSLDELTEKTIEIWEKITPEMCENLVNSMPKRAQAVYEAKGGVTKY